MHRHFLKPKLLRGFESGVSTDDHPIGVDDNGLSETKLLDAAGHGIDRIVVDAGVVRVRLDVCNASKFNLHVRFLNTRDLNSLNARIVVSAGSRLHRSSLVPLVVEAPVVIQPSKTRTFHFMRASFRIDGVGMTSLKWVFRPTKQTL